MNLLQNFDLLSVGISVAAIGILGFVVFFNNRSSETNRSFLYFALATITYSVANYLSYQTTEPESVLLVIRIVMFFTVWHTFSLFHLFYVFPDGELHASAKYKFLALPLTFVVSILSLTPLVFSGLSHAIGGGVAKPEPGPAIPLYGITIISLLVGAFVIMARKMRRHTGAERRQMRDILIGSLITFPLLIVCNFIFPVFLNDVRFIPYAGAFSFPFIAFTGYGILRHRFLNVKVVSTEILTFILSMSLLVEAIVSRDPFTILYKTVVFSVVLMIGILLIRSVRDEVSQREHVTVLAESLEKANIRLQELDRQKTEFLSIASHQLRTPLSIIKGYIELIGDGAYGKPTKKLLSVLGDMDESNERLITLVDEFLDVSRIEQGRTKFSFSPNDMNELIASVVKELTDRAHDKKMDLIWKPNAALPSVMIDEEKIRHVVFNFVDNAIKYSDAGNITVSAVKDKDGLAVRVVDEGIGFLREDEVNFFQKFYRGKNVEGVNVNGTGLGIYVCRQFIEAHSGRVWAHSPGPGKGSEFGFWIPLKQKSVSGTSIPNNVSAAKPAPLVNP